MVDIIKYKKIIRLKIFLKVGLKNLGMKCLGNSIHDRCLKKTEKNNSVRYSRFVLEKKTQIFEDNF